MMRFAFALLVCAATIAGADPEKARLRYDQSVKLYNLAKFKEAIAELEAAYQEEPDAAYLFNLAQEHRADKNHERALFFYRRYLELVPDTTNRAEIETNIAELEKAIAERPVIKPPPPPGIKHVRIGVDVGFTTLYYVGYSDSRQSPQIGGRILVAYIRKLGDNTLDIGGSWQITTVPYDTPMGESVSSSFTQLHAIVAISRPLYKSLWGRAGIGLGFSQFGGLKDGNPVTEMERQSGDVRMLCARVDTVVGYRMNDSVDFILGLLSASYSAANKDLDDRISKVTTLEGISLGVFLKF